MHSTVQYFALSGTGTHTVPTTLNCIEFSYLRDSLIKPEVKNINIGGQLLRKFSLVLTLICVAVTAQASQIFSDGFEPGPGGAFTLTTATHLIGVWTVGSGSVDWIGTYWVPFEGTGSVDMSGDGPGSISTPLSTISGQDYVLSFYLAGNPDGGNTVKSLQVQVGNINQPFTFDTVAAHSSSGLSGNLGWIQFLVPFTASVDNTLTFTSNEPNAFGPALDLVTVDSVPEPATYTFGLIGFAGIGLGLFRRRR